MNELEFERVATHAAAATRAAAERIADSPSALAALLATEPAQIDGRPSVVVDFAEVRSRRRTPWIPILVAAASVAAITGIVLTTRDGDDTLVVTTEPSVPDPTAPIDDTIPGVVPDPTAVPTTTAVPDSTIPLDPTAVVVVPDERGEQLARTVLTTYGAGAGPGDLGFESCQECEPVRPFAPIVSDDGTVFVADAFNDRWQIFRNGAWTSLPYRPGEVVTAAPVMGPDGLIYASVADDLAARTGLRIVSYDPLTMDVVDSYPGGNPAVSAVDLVNDAIEVGGNRVHTFDAPLGRPTWNVDEQASLVTLSLSGIQRSFQLPTNWATDNTEAMALDDGSIVLRGYALDESGPLGWLLVRLWPDGTWATGTIGANPSTTSLDGRFAGTGYVQLEDAIVEYALPAKPASTPTDTAGDDTTVITELQPRAVQADVLYRATVGNAVDQLGREDCQECENTVPWGPVVLPDGRLVIVDNTNRRWITVTDGVPVATPLPDRIGIVSQPVVDADGRIAVVAQVASAASPGAVEFFDPADLSAPVDEFAVDAVMFSRLELEGTDVVVNDQVVGALPTSVGPLPEVEYAFDRSPATVTVAWGGQRRTWQFPIGLGLTGGTRLPDGSITATVFDGGQLLLVRLLPDGTTGATVIGTPASWNGGSSTTLDGLVQLELDGTDWVVRRYPLPTG